jgi:hypothetical protein
MGGVMNAKLLSLLLVPGVCLTEGVWAQEEEDGGEIPAVGVSRPVLLEEGSPRSWVGTVKAAETVSVTARNQAVGRGVPAEPFFALPCSAALPARNMHENLRGLCGLRVSPSPAGRGGRGCALAGRGRRQ